jgi:predicted O-methyltransferase YrrM
MITKLMRKMFVKPVWQAQLTFYIAKNANDFEKFCNEKSINYDISSNHYKFFFNLRENGFNPKRILEIGTFKGFTVNFLNNLFPNSYIDTYDLPSNDPLYENLDNKIIDPRKKKSFAKNDDIVRLKFNNKKNTFHKINTCHLYKFTKKKYDLIWLDGSHSFPEVSWDIFYGLAVLNKSGFLLVDDVYIDKYYKKINFLDQIDAYKVIKYYNQRNKIKFKFFLKRSNTLEKKFIAYYENLKN